jgi:hypothetical protein
MDLIIGIGSLALAVFLVFIARPNKAGQHPPFLRFEPALVLYPPLVLVFAVMGAAEIITVLLGIQR